VLTVTPPEPLNNAAPDLVLLPIVNVSVTIVPENVIVEIVVSALLTTSITVVPLSVILGEIVLAVEALNNNVP